MLLPVPFVGAGVAKDDLAVACSVEMTTLVPTGIHHPRCLAALVRSESTVSKSDGETGETKRSESHFDGWMTESKSGFDRRREEKRTEKQAKDSPVMNIGVGIKS